MAFSHFQPIFNKFRPNVATLNSKTSVLKKRLLVRIQHSDCRHLEFGKTDAVSSFFDQISPNLVGLLRL